MSLGTNRSSAGGKEGKDIPSMYKDTVKKYLISLANCKMFRILGIKFAGGKIIAESWQEPSNKVPFRSC